MKNDGSGTVFFFKFLDPDWEFKNHSQHTLFREEKKILDASLTVVKVVKKDWIRVLLRLVESKVNK